MACESCRQRYLARKAARENGAVAQAVNQSARVRPRIKSKGPIMKKPFVQPQPAEATIIPAPDCGAKDASTGQLKTLIKEGTMEPGRAGKPMETTVHIPTELEKGYSEAK